MITEDYVSFETAKLLKEKGFDDKCRALYTFWFDKVEGPKEDRAENWNVEPKYFSAPTLQMAMKWLREIHHLEIYLEHDAIRENNNWWYGIGKYTKGCISIQHESESDYATYELASESAIKYCLENLI